MQSQTSINNGSVKEVRIFNAYTPQSGFDISDLVNEFNIYQSIDTPFYTGKIVIIDGVGLFNNIYIMGNEIVTVSYSSALPNKPEAINTSTFIVTSVEKVQSENNNYIYVLSLGSSHWLKNASTKISQAYSGKSSDIIAQILKNKLNLTEDEYLISKTTDNIKVVIPNLNISESLLFISRRASSPNGTPCFTYEHLDGTMEFSSLENLYSRAPLFTYYKNIRLTSDPITTYFNINKLKIDNISQGYKNIIGGMYSAKVFAFDMLTRNFIEHKFNLADKENDKTFLNTALYDPVMNINGKGIQEIADSKIYTILTSSNGSNTLNPRITSTQGEIGDYHTNAEFKVPFLNSKLQQLENCVITIEVQGNTSIFPGSIIELSVPSPDFQNSEEEDSKRDKFLSGKYVTIGVRHIFTQQGFKTLAQLAKDSFGN